MKKIIALALFALVMTGCTSVKVNKVSEEHEIVKICIEENNKVTYSEFLEVVRDRLTYHSIDNLVYRDPENIPEGCEYTFWYTALRSWDLVTYLSHAELKVYKNKELIGDAEYHLNGGGGLAMTKFASTENKMNPVIDELLNKPKK